MPYTVAEAAEVIGKSKAAVFRAIRKGTLSHLVAWIRQESSKIRYLWRLTDSEVSSLFNELAYPCNKVPARQSE